MHPFTCKFEQFPITTRMISSCSISAFSPVTHHFIRVHSILPFHFLLGLATCRSLDSSSRFPFGHPNQLGRPHHCQSILAECMPLHGGSGSGAFMLFRLNCKALSRHKHKNKTCQESHLQKRCKLEVSRGRPAGWLTEKLRDSLVPWQCRASV